MVSNRSRSSCTDLPEINLRSTRDERVYGDAYYGNINFEAKI